ncbi:hypothetical protein EIP91_000211 [Steccherinum ochraceum]|uniref:Uncharacterized protein n=1 Tax=Steccherinum ochraceum TaxID=92696 RepID=A0A4V2MXR7_9APHY|nr:hypothetical protein EIP91_000211 [Steccherinum ochraceum]
MTAEDVDSLRISLESLRYHSYEDNLDNLSAILSFGQRYIFNSVPSSPHELLTLQRTTFGGVSCGSYHLRPQAEGSHPSLDNASVHGEKAVDFSMWVGERANRDNTSREYQALRDLLAAARTDSLPLIENARSTPRLPLAKRSTPVVVLEVPPDHVSWDGLASSLTHGSVQPTLGCGQYAIVVRSLVKSPKPSISFMPPVHLESADSLRCVIGAALNSSNSNRHFSPVVESTPFVLGAARNSSDLPVSFYNDNPQCFADFDFFMMQRSLPVLRACLRWKEQAIVRRVAVNDILKVHIDASTREHATLTFKTPIDDDDYDPGPLRRRQSEVEDFLSDESSDFHFKVSQVLLPDDAEAYSQQYLGHLERVRTMQITGQTVQQFQETCSTRIRLTLFDERLFPMPPDQDLLDEFGYNDHGSEESYPISCVREAAGPARHVATVLLWISQTGMAGFIYVYGFFTEDVQGSLLPGPQELPDILLQRRLVQSLYLAQRTLASKGVGKEWSPESIITTQRPEHANDETPFTLVGRDFGFARLRLGQDLFFPPIQEPVAEMYGVSSGGPWNALDDLGYEYSDALYDGAPELDEL